MVTPLVAPMGLWALLTLPVEGLDVYPTLGCYGDFDLLCQAGGTVPVRSAGKGRSSFLREFALYGKT